MVSRQHLREAQPGPLFLISTPDIQDPANLGAFRRIVAPYGITIQSHDDPSAPMIAAADFDSVWLPEH